MAGSKTKENKERIVYLEICRIMAIFCIMFQHTGGRGADAWKYTESIWVYMTSLVGNILSSIGVPLFWMVSGALLLPKKESWKKVYGKRCLRISAVLILFSVIRYLYLCIVENHDGSLGEFFRRLYTQEIFLPYWFLYEYLGILAVLPFLRKLIQNLSEQEEGLLSALLIGWHVINDISNTYLGTGFVINLRFHSPLSYFILGYLMEHCRILERNERRGLKLAVGFAVTATASLYIWVRGQHRLESLESLVMLLTISVYYIIRYVGERSLWNRTALRHIVLWCGSNVFGIYLIEDYLRNGTSLVWDWLSPYITAVPACCVWLLAVFALGNVLVSFARRIPILENLL